MKSYQWIVCIAAAAAWACGGSDATSGGGDAGGLTFAFDRTTGNNGDVAHLTITAVTAGPHVFSVTSTLGTTEHSWLGLVGQN